MTDEHLGWLISVKGWQDMATRPTPYYAHTETEKDWYLKNSGQPEIYDITRVPDPLTAEERAERNRLVFGDEEGPRP